MTIQKWDPFYEIDRLHDEMDKLFSSRWPVRRASGSSGTCAMPVDIVETPNEVVIRAEIPGINPEDVEVKVEDGVLSITGEKKFEEKEGDKESYLRVERYYGKFSRSFVVPRYVDSANVQAEYSAGILTLTLPRKEETQPKKIDVKVAAR